MDPGRYGVHQGWDNNSALEGYGAAHDPNFRVGSSYDDRRFIDDRYSGESIYQRNAYPHDVLERENYAPPSSAAGLWPNSRKRIHEEEYTLKRGSRRHDKRYADDYNDIDTYRDREVATFEGHEKRRDGYLSVDNYRDHGYDWPTRVGGRNHDDYSYDDHGHGNHSPHQHTDGSRERDHRYGRHSFDSDYDRKGRREGTSRRRDYRDRDHDKRISSRERDHSPRGTYRQSHSRSRSRSHSPSRSRSYGQDDHLKSRSPHSRSCSRSYREDSYDDGWHERSDRQRGRGEKRHHEAYAVAPSATVVVKGLSQKTTEEDLYQILQAEWGTLRHVRVIKERMSGLSRGFAFIDFPSVDSAKAMMDQIGEDGLVVDGRKIFFEYSSKPTGSGGAFTQENYVKSGHGNHRSMIVPSDWMCIICVCVNFARRTSCFQCNEPRGDDAPAADMISSQATLGRRGLEAGPTHVLVVRGLDENADEEMLRYEFSKHAPIKDLRLVRDKFTHVSRGFAFVHFHSVEEATKALEATNGTALEKNGQMLRVAYAKNVLGPGSGSSASSQSISLAAAAIEAAAFSQQYDAVGWAPKEYNPEGKEADGSGQGQGDGRDSVRKDGSALQSGFVWDEASGYYCDASSGFYYDGNTGLYYDGNNAIWYSFDHQTQQYIPCNDQSESKQLEPSKGSDTSTNRKVVISAPAATITSSEKASLPDAVQAAAAAAIASEKKEKEKMKEIKLASRSSILANKKKMNNVLTMWKQRSHEGGGQATRIAVDETIQLSTPSTEDKTLAALRSNKIRPKAELTPNRDPNAPSLTLQTATSDSTPQPRTIGGNTTGGTLMGVIRGGSGRRVVKSTETLPSASSAVASSTLGNVDIPTATTPFKTDVSALGVYSTPSAAVSGKRRFSETPLSSASASNHREPLQSGYRDRAAERRSLYGSSSGADDLSDLQQTNSNREPGLKKDSMPFPPGVGGGRAPGDSSSNAGPSYDVITADKAIDESNVGNRMLRNMGWQEGLGLGKDGSGMVEPVQAQAVDSRAGLGSQPKKKVTDPSLEVQAGDSYRTLIHKKALARFRDMS